MPASKTRYDTTIEKFKNNPVVVVILIASAVLIALAANIEAIKKIVGIIPAYHQEKKDSSRTKDSILILPQKKPQQPHEKKIIQPASEDNKTDSVFAVSIFSDPPDADIFINNQFYGKTNREVKLERGHYKLELKTRNIKHEDIIVIPDQTLISVDLSKNNNE